MRRKPRLTAMRRNRAKYFPESTQDKMLQFDIAVRQGTKGQLVDGELRQVPSPCIVLKITKPGRRPLSVELEPEDAYEIREDIGRAYDQINGI